MKVLPQMKHFFSLHAASIMSFIISSRFLPFVIFPLARARSLLLFSRGSPLSQNLDLVKLFFHWVLPSKNSLRNLLTESKKYEILRSKVREMGGEAND